MIRHELTEEIIEYIFDPEEGKHFANKIVVLLNKNKVMLIDTGYEFQALEVLEDLDSRNQVIEGIIISHFHSDHMNGLKVLPKATIYGSSEYNTTLEMWTSQEEHKYFTPDVSVKEPYVIKFGNHNIEMIPFPGHSICGILVSINNKYLHISDELMFSNEGQPLLPCVAGKEGVKAQLESIKKLKNYTEHTFIPAHGATITDKEKIEEIIINTEKYLNAILSNNGKITYEEAVKDCSREFLHKEWHRFVYE